MGQTISGLLGYYTAQEQMDDMNYQAQTNRDFSKEMYIMQRDDYLKNYPTLLKQQADEQFNLWKNQFDVQTAYNNPGAAAARSLVAGFNPASQNGLVTGQSSQMGAQSSVSPPPIIHGSPLGGSVSPVGIGNNFGNILGELGSFVKDISESKVNSSTINKIDAEIEKFLSEKELNDSLKEYQDIRNGITQVFGYKRESIELIKIMKDSYKAESEGDYAKAAELNQRALARLNNSNAVINEAKYPFVVKEMKRNIERLEAEIRNQNAQASEALSRKELNTANKELADIAIQVKNAENTPDILAQKSKSILVKLQRDESISKKDVEEARRRIEKLEGIKRTRDNAGFVSRAVDDFFSWWTDHISTAVTGGVHASVSDNNSHSSVNYE